MVIDNYKDWIEKYNSVSKNNKKLFHRAVIVLW